MRVKNYWSRRLDGFLKLRTAEMKSNKYDRWEEEILSKLPKEQKLRILDVGCGTGFFSILLARQGHDVTGVDLTEDMVVGARLSAEQAGQSIDFLQMDAESLDFDDCSFDVVISRNVTWTLPRPGMAYQEWMRVLKPGGILLNYDAEYAREEIYKKESEHNAHENMSNDLMQECQNIYSLLAISHLRRPEWDQKVFESMGYTNFAVDLEVGNRIYREEDQFFLQVPMFGIKVIKEKS